MSDGDAAGAPGEIDPAVHKRLAVGLFNRAWDLMELPERTTEQDFELIHCAHASRHHWAEVGTAVNLARGEWQVSRAYAVLGRAEPALVHARESLRVCEANGIGDFDVAYAHEALARAHALAGDTNESTRQVELAKEAGADIREDGDRAQLVSDLATIPTGG